MTEVPTIQKISPLFSRVNQWTGFYIIGTSVTKELNLRLKKMIFEGILFPYFQHSSPKQEVHFPRKCIFFQITLSGINRQNVLVYFFRSSICLVQISWKSLKIPRKYNTNPQNTFADSIFRWPLCFTFTDSANWCSVANQVVACTTLSYTAGAISANTWFQNWSMLRQWKIRALAS